MFRSKKTIYEVFNIDKTSTNKYNEVFKAMEYNDDFTIDAFPAICFTPSCMERLLKKYDTIEDQIINTPLISDIVIKDIRKDLEKAGVTYISEEDIMGIMKTAVENYVNDLNYNTPLELLSYIGYIDFTNPILKEFQEDVLKNGFLASELVPDEVKKFLTDEKNQRYYHYNVYDLDNYFLSLRDENNKIMTNNYERE